MKDTWHIHIKGIVQGVGFRPFVYQLAHSFTINGWVNNDIDGVHIEFNANIEQAHDFYYQILASPPPLAEITASTLTNCATPIAYDDFQIIHSNASGKYDLKVTPDYSLCAECTSEIQDPFDRRNGYAFTTCTNCGPRYSIINQLPYDRPFTQMSEYKMCPKCHEEYHNPLDRRYYSQTNSCHDCGVKMKILDVEGLPIEENQKEIINTCVQFLSAGKIIAIKGIGGYLIVADASNDVVVQQLRTRKSRPQKPFALMYPSMDAAEKDLMISSIEKEALLSAASPIVLLSKKRALLPNISPLVAPGLSSLGIMLPYTPLYALLLANFKHPIIATSGNVSGAPIVFEDKKVVRQLGGIADYILTNDRDITTSQDDSVFRFSALAKQKIVLRRARGIAPNFIPSASDFETNNYIALGANAKSTFALTQGKNIFISQYLGNLDDYDAQINYEKALNHLMKMTSVTLQIILTDKHPAFYTHQKGANLANTYACNIHEVQHHEAHFAAILGEHNLIASKEKILGIIWDGTGWGNDEQVWGGEFFTYQDFRIKRSKHFTYSQQLLGDKMSIEPRLSALSFFGEMEAAAPVLSKKFTAKEWNLYPKMLRQKSTLKTSSIGRLFDAVASILGLIDISTYEAEAAIKLEILAQKWVNKNGLHAPIYYPIDRLNTSTISIQKMKNEILLDIKNKVSKEEIAYKFHETLVQIIAIEAKLIFTNNDPKSAIAFSGGVFQNALLVDIIYKRLEHHYPLYFHSTLSPGDENISFGQIIHHKIHEMRKSHPIKNKILCA